MRPLKIKLLVVSGIFPPDYGGPASYIPTIASALAKRHIVLGVVTLSEGGNHNDTDYPFLVKRIPRRQNRLFRVVRTIKIIHGLSRNADVVYLNGLIFEGIVACKIFRRRPVVIKVVGDPVWERARCLGITDDSLEAFQGNRHSPFWEFLKHLQRWCMRRADRIICPSRYLKSIVEGWQISGDRIDTVYNAVEFTGNAAEWPKDEPFDLVTVCRLVPWKGVRELIDLSIQNGWRLKIVGDGPLRPDLEEHVAAHRATGVICFRGSVPRREVSNEIGTARVFVLNSSYEGLPHIVLEAKAAGVPVIATAAGGTPETITHGVDGFLVPINDNDALAQTVRYLLDHPEERERISGAGRRQIESQFSLESMASETAKVLQVVCSRGGEHTNLVGPS